MKFLKLIALLEGVSLLTLLFVAMPMKYMMAMPEMVQMIGPVHGVLFLVFNVVLVLYFVMKKVTADQMGLGMIASLLPFGTFVFKVKVL
jgi:integral membrane protein